jgi:AGZA family xanthine/uracil permease-like MFS transporter
MRWFVRGDLDGFFGLALDNLVQLLLIVSLCQFVLKFPPDLVHGHILPGAAVSLLVGNLFYAWQARRLAAAQGRRDVCALPYGINTVSIFAHVFLVMLPASLMAQAAGVPVEEAARIAWRAGLVACLGSGLIELAGAFVAERIRKASPRAALLSTLAGIALGFISFTFLFRTFATPLVGLTTLGVILLTYFGRVRFRGALPGGLVAVALGTLLAWLTGLTGTATQPTVAAGFYPPVPVLGDLLAALAGKDLLTYLAVIIPMGVFNIIGSLQNIESAEAAGDLYPTRPSLMVNGLGSVAAALFGSCFPTTIYIGHPGWKALGARAGYSVLNGVFCTALCLTGTMAWVAWAVPIEAGMAIVVWIGVVITAQAFQATPREHAPAVVIGLLPSIGAWGVLMAKDGLRVGASVSGQPLTFSDRLIPAFQQGGTYIHGAFALEQGFIFTAMIFSALTVHLIERRFHLAALWCLAAAGLTALGFMHSYGFIPGDTVGRLFSPGWPWVWGYLAMAAIFFLARWVTESDVEHL